MEDQRRQGVRVSQDTSRVSWLVLHSSNMDHRNMDHSEHTEHTGDGLCIDASLEQRPGLCWRVHENGIDPVENMGGVDGPILEKI